MITRLLRHKLPLLLLLSLPVAAAELTPHSLQYHSRIKGFDIEGVRELTRQDDHYRLSQKATAVLSRIEEESLFHLDDKGQIKPISYEYSRRIFGRSVVRKNSFSDDRSDAAYRENRDKSVTIDTPEPVFDPLNFQIAIQQQLLANGELHTNRYLLLDRDRIREHRYQVAGSEWLKTPAGYFDTLKIKRIRDDSDKSTMIWLAKDWDYVILQIRHSQDGKDGDSLHFVSGTLDGKKMTGEKQLPAQQD